MSKIKTLLWLCVIISIGFNAYQFSRSLRIRRNQNVSYDAQHPNLQNTKVKKSFIRNMSFADSDKYLKRSLNETTRLQFLSLLDSLRTILSAEGIEMVMCDGTLMGSYFFHDIIPWDDDADVMIHVKHRAKVFKLFADKALRRIFDVHSFDSIENFYDIKHLNNPSTIDQSKDLKFKFYRQQSPKVGKYEWKWPFIDVKYFENKNKKVYKVQIKNPEPPFHYDKFYPLKYRPLGPYWFLSPFDTRYVLFKKYQSFSCKSSSWDHEHEKKKKAVVKPCSELVSIYPYVQRIWDGSIAFELLMLRDKVIQVVQVQEPFYNITGLFNLK